MKTSFCIFLVALCLFVAHSATKTVNGSYLTSKDLSPAFSRITLNGIYKIQLKKSTTQHMNIKAPSQQVAELVKTKIDQSGLRVYLEGPNGNANFNGEISIVLEYKDLNALIIDGVIQAKLGPVKQNELDLSVRSTSALDCLRIETAKQLTVSVDGTTNVIIRSGATPQMKASVTGVGKLNAGSLKADNIEIRVGGVSEASVRAIKTLKPTVEGVSVLNVVKSKPQVVDQKIDFMAELNYVNK